MRTNFQSFDTRADWQLLLASSLNIYPALNRLLTLNIFLFQICDNSNDRADLWARSFRGGNKWDARAEQFWTYLQGKINYLWLCGTFFQKDHEEFRQICTHSVVRYFISTSLGYFSIISYTVLLFSVIYIYIWTLFLHVLLKWNRAQVGGRALVGIKKCW